MNEKKITIQGIKYSCRPETEEEMFGSKCCNCSFDDTPYCEMVKCLAADRKDGTSVVWEKSRSTKVYLIHQQTIEDEKSGIHPCPSTVIRAYEYEEDAIDFLRNEFEKNDGYEFANQWKIITGNQGSLFIKEIDLD